MADRDAAMRSRVPANRRELEARVDRLVRENRFTISVVFPLNGALLLVASAEGLLPPPLAFNPLLVLFGTLVMRSPLLAGVAPLVDRRAVLGLGGLVTYTYLVEYVGIRTGYPYGEFYYAVDLGPTVAGVPVGLPVFFIPLVINAYLLSLLLLGRRADHAPTRVGFVIAAVLAMDVVLDPGAVALGFWVYPDGGVFYGVPASNYVGWVLSATVAVVTLDAAFFRERLRERLTQCEFMLDDLVSFVILWGGINAWFGNWVAVAVAAVFGGGLLRAKRFDAGLVRLPAVWDWKN